MRLPFVHHAVAGRARITGALVRPLKFVGCCRPGVRITHSRIELPVRFE